MKLKRKKEALILTLTLALCGNAIGSQGTFDQEDSWQPVSFSLPGFEGEVQAWRTDRNSLRIETLPSIMTAQAMLYPPDRDGVPADRFAEWCALRPPVRVIKSEGKTFRFVGLVPSNRAIFSLDRRVPESAVENQPRFEDLQIQVTLAPDSLTRMESRIRPETVQKMIAPAIASQNEFLKKTGRFNFELRGMDDLACDLALGKAEIGLVARFSLENAKLSRIPVISAAEVGRVHDSIRTPGSNAADSRRVLILSGARLALALEKQTPYSLDRFGAENFLKLYARLFKGLSGEPEMLLSSDYARIARSMDQTELRQNVQSPLVRQNVRISPEVAQ